MPNAAELLGGPPHQDYINLAGFPSPGAAVVKGAGSPRNWDIQKGYGRSGATTIFTGEDLAKFDVDIFCWEPEHFLAWQIFAQATLVNPPIGAFPFSMAIQHPALNDAPLSITQVVVTNVTQWEQSDDTGLWCRTISFLQYRKPKDALVKPFEGPPGSPVVVTIADDPSIVALDMESKAKSAEIAQLYAVGR